MAFLDNPGCLSPRQRRGRIFDMVCESFQRNR
jgi:hypothetical protein